MHTLLTIFTICGKEYQKLNSEKHNPGNNCFSVFYLKILWDHCMLIFYSQYNSQMHTTVSWCVINKYKIIDSCVHGQALATLFE